MCFVLFFFLVVENLSVSYFHNESIQFALHSQWSRSRGVHLACLNVLFL